MNQLPIEAMSTEIAEIIATCNSVFTNSDAHRWDQVKASFADSVRIDYSSLTGQPPTTLSAEAIVNAWSGFLPKFKYTMHFISNHSVAVEETTATVSCYGHAIHVLPDAKGGSFWEVYGTYNLELKKFENQWRVVALTYNHRYAAGNMDLPAIATQAQQ